MRNLTFIIILLVSAVLFSCCNQPSETRDVKQYTIEQFMNNTSIGGGSFSSDNQKVLVTSNESGIYNVYTIASDGGLPEPVTHSDTSSIFAISFFPDDDRILFRSDNNGNEIYHIFLRDTDGAVTDLTPTPEARSSFYGWAHDKQSFFYTSNKRDERFMDLYEMSIGNFQSKMLFENTEGYSISALSPNKQYLALAKSITTSINELFLYDLKNDKLIPISPEEPNSSYSATDFSLDNKTFYYITDEGVEFSYLVKYDIETGEKEKMYAEDWDVTYAYFSYNEKYLVIGVNEDARTQIRLFDAKTMNPVQFPDIDAGEISSVRISRDEKMMSFSAGSSRSTSDIYTYNFRSGKVVKLTNTLNPEIDTDDLVAGKVVRYKSFDGLEIPAIMYMPHNASAENKVPALVWVHGGPGGQSTLYYRPLIQYLVNHGYAIIAVNNRGSSGYGKTFYRMDDQNHGEGDLMDCIYAKDYLESTGKIDPEKIGIIGGSYGGYMVMQALTDKPDAFAVGVNLFGVTNWLRTLKSIPPWWESFRNALYEEMGDPAVDSTRLYRISPLFHAHKIERPVMVLQGAQDPRVLQVESDEIVEAARAKGVPVEYVLFDDEGHGFVKKENQIEANGKILEFLNEYLKGKEAI
jgi:dipeptidyl aminopeptidase/acylaminoacyl peptidase